ncbi:hypothetical protein BHE74_00018656 [Ensete ventricosum]|nr:hypothetical protein BHE74_00018656 [Ensete ventricosum]
MRNDVSCLYDTLSGRAATDRSIRTDNSQPYESTMLSMSPEVRSRARLTTHLPDAPFPTDVDELAHTGGTGRVNPPAMTLSTTSFLALKGGPDVARTDAHSPVDPTDRRAGLSPPGGRNQCVGTHVESLLEAV